jgi:hypothetical protein
MTASRSGVPSAEVNLEEGYEEPAGFVINRAGNFERRARTDC